MSNHSRIYVKSDEIEQRIALSDAERASILDTSSRYKFWMTEHLASLIKNSASEGMRKQFLPSSAELQQGNDEFTDVSDEKNYSPVPGIIHRYPNKVLLLLTLNCPSYCRFCFRKEKLNDKNSKRILPKKDIRQALDYIRQNNIEEVIFSGGDPFFCSDDLLEEVTQALKDTGQVNIVRFHTRYLTFDPYRLTDRLFSRISKIKATYLIAHVNQRAEVTEGFIGAADRAFKAGISVLTQTAFLKGVNDDESELGSLFRILVVNRIKPYYLFHTDPGQGLGHFRVGLEKGIQIYTNLFDRISGLGMPIYLFNIPGGFGHSIIDLGNVRRLGGDKFELTTWEGKKVVYNDRWGQIERAKSEDGTYD